ncbi:MAG: ribonuclease P protein component [Chloroflexi bacterium]|nr:ribonuclease P protein component [Chloroflexota bacterium]
MAIRLETLRRPADFAALQQHGRSRAHPLVVVRAVHNGLDCTRYAFSTGRHLGGAVVRNRVRRRLREIVRSLASRVAPGWDVLIVARPASVVAGYLELRDAVALLLGRLGVLTAEERAG